MTEVGSVEFSMGVDLETLNADLRTAFRNIESFAMNAEKALFLQSSGVKVDTVKIGKDFNNQVRAIVTNISPTISPKIDTKKLNSIKSELNSIQIKTTGPAGPMGGETTLLNNIKKINDLLTGKSEAINKVKDTQTREVLQEPLSKEKIGKLVGMALSEQLSGLKAKLPAPNKLLSENQKEAGKIISEPVSIDSIRKISELAIRDEIAKFKPQINPNSNIPMEVQKDAIKIINQPMSLEKIKQMVGLALKDQMRSFEQNPITQPKINIPTPAPINIPTPKIAEPITTRVIKIETGPIKKQIEEIEAISNLAPIITPQIDTSKIQEQLAVLQNIPISPKIDTSVLAEQQLKMALTIPQETEKNLIDKVKQVNQILFNPNSEQIKKVNNPDLTKTLEEPFSGEKIKKILGMAVENEIKKFKIKPSTLPKETTQQATEIIDQPISVESIKKLTELAVRQEVDKIQLKRTDKPIPLEVNDFLASPDLEKTKKIIDLAIGEEIEKIKPKLTTLAGIISQIKPFAGESLMSPPPAPPAPPGPGGPGGPKPTAQPSPPLRDIDVIGIKKKFDPIDDIKKLLGFKKEVEGITVKAREITGDNIIDLTKDFEGGAKKLGELLKAENKPKLPADTKLLSNNIEKKINISVDEAKKKQAIDAVNNIKVSPPKVDLSPTKEAGEKINSSIEQSSGKLEDAINKTQKNSADSRKKIIEDLFKMERDLAIENILDVEAQKIDSLRRIANQNDLSGDENKRQQSLQGISAEVNILMPLDKVKSDLEYKLQIASLNENEVVAEQLKQQIFQQNLKITEAKYRADSEALQLQIDGKNIALETARIQAQIALAETEANLNRAIANGDKARSITALQTELEYRQKLVDSATANINNTQKINELEKKRLLLTSQNTIQGIKQSRELERLKQAKAKENKGIKETKQATNSMLKSPRVRLIEQEQLSLDLVKKKFDIATKYLEALKDIGDRSIDLFETTTNPQLVLDVLAKQEQLQQRINKSKIDALKEEIKLNLHNLEIERAKDISSQNRNEAESRQEILRAKQTILRAEKSGDQISIQGAKQELAIATENLSVVLQEREYANQIYIHKKQQLAIEGKSSLLLEKMSQRAGLIASYQNKINSAGKTYNNILDQQQKQLQSIGDLNKTIFDARVNALSQESGLLDKAIELRAKLDSGDDMPKTFTDEMNKQLRAIAGSSDVSEKTLLMDRLKLDEQLAKEKMTALKAEHDMQKSLLQIDLNKQKIQAEMAVMQAKLMAMSLKGSPLEKEGQGLIIDAVKNQINVENLGKNALDSLGIKQAMEQYNLGMDNFRNINQQRLNVAEKGYVPQGELPQLPKQYDVPNLKNQQQYQPVNIGDYLLKDMINLIDQNRNESLLSNIESIAGQILDKLDVLPTTNQPNKPDSNIPSMASGGSNNSNLPTPPVVNNNYGGFTIISSDPTGDARKVLNDLTKNKNK